MCSKPKSPSQPAQLPPLQATMPQPVGSPEAGRRAPGLAALRIPARTAPSL